jgi:hypothetical protein
MLHYTLEEQEKQAAFINAVHYDSNIEGDSQAIQDPYWSAREIWLLVRSDGSYKSWSYFSKIIQQAISRYTYFCPTGNVAAHFRPASTMVNSKGKTTKCELRDYHLLVVGCYLLDERLGLYRFSWKNALIEYIKATQPMLAQTRQELIDFLIAYHWFGSPTTLAELGTVEAVEPLIARLTLDGTDELSWEIVEALGKLGDARAIAPLVNLLENSTNGIDYHYGPYPLKRHAAAALAQIQDVSVVESLLKALQSEATEFIRCELIKALGEVGDRRALPQLELLISTQEQSSNYIVSEVKMAISKIISKNEK